jgi:hypothetical protein
LLGENFYKLTSEQLREAIIATNENLFEKYKDDFNFPKRFESQFVELPKRERIFSVARRTPLGPTR